jgi:MFS family permease
MKRAAPRWVVVIGVGMTQTLAWGSTYYLPAILADDVASGTGLTRNWVFGAFSGSLLVAAGLGPVIGRSIDRYGGRPVLVASNLVMAIGLSALAVAENAIGLSAAWLVLGLGMALGLYDAAFATLATLYGSQARGPITGITLIAGFASTIGWPLTAALEAKLGWRGACLVWAALHGVVGLPVNALVVPGVMRSAGERRPSKTIGWKPRKEMLLLAFTFAASWFVTGAMAAHFPTLLERAGTSHQAAITAGALIGPAQVGARVLEFVIMRRAHPLVPARLAAMLHPLGAVLFAAMGAPAAALFALLHGAGNGLLTIARGTVPLAVFGPIGYGARTGLLGAPARAAQAAAPLLFGILLDKLGEYALIVSGGLSLLALIALLGLRAKPSVPFDGGEQTRAE